MIEEYVDTEELRRLLSTLIVILGALAVAGLFAIIVVPGLRNANKPEAPTPMSPVGGQPGWLDLTEFPPERGRVIPPVDPKTLIAASPQLIDEGRNLFEANCVQCHGEQGHGDGPAAVTMNPSPRNFTSPNGWTNGYDLPAIYKTLTNGVPGTSMASFNYLSRKDRMALAHYIQSLGAFPHGTGSPEALAALSKDLAAPGEKTLNKIPVSMAMAKLEAEYVAPPPLSAPAVPGGYLVARMVIDRARAAQTLALAPSWKGSARALAGVIVPGTPVDGFAVSVATLGPEQWQVLYEALLTATHEQPQRVSMESRRTRGSPDTALKPRSRAPDGK
jgi:mono/diheme cytochrome c family protein